MSPLDAPDVPDAASGDAAVDAASSDGCDIRAQTPDQPPVVLINEVFAGSLIDDQLDWFELHNPGERAISLDGWTIEDSFTGDAPKDVPGRLEFAPGTVLCAGAFLDVRRGDACEDVPNVFDFGIGDTDRLVLADASGNVIDEVAWRELPHDQSAGRVDDQPGEFRRLARRTPGFPNAVECECCGECLVGRCELRDGRCEVGRAEDCRTSVACEQLGWCGLQDGRCVPITDADCEQSLVCERRGHCGLREGSCEVVADTDCRRSKACENEGRCTADVEAGMCIATSQADCAASDDCMHTRLDGSVEIKNRCTLSGERCVADSCADTSVCQEKMCCTLADGKCVRL